MYIVAPLQSAVTLKMESQRARTGSLNFIGCENMWRRHMRVINFRSSFVVTTSFATLYEHTGKVYCILKTATHCHDFRRLVPFGTWGHYFLLRTRLKATGISIKVFTGSHSSIWEKFEEDNAAWLWNNRTSCHIQKSISMQAIDKSV